MCGWKEHGFELGEGKNMSWFRRRKMPKAAVEAMLRSRKTPRHLKEAWRKRL